jgi:hypothetical protein
MSPECSCSLRANAASCSDRPVKAKVLPGVALDSFTGDPNFMASLARGLVVIEAFTPQTPQMTISQLSPAHRPLARCGAPLPLHIGQARLRRRG